MHWHILYKRRQGTAISASPAQSVVLVLTARHAPGLIDGPHPRHWVMLTLPLTNRMIYDSHPGVQAGEGSPRRQRVVLTSEVECQAPFPSASPGIVCADLSALSRSYRGGTACRKFGTAKGEIEDAGPGLWRASWPVAEGRPAICGGPPECDEVGDKGPRPRDDCILKLVFLVPEPRCIPLVTSQFLSG